MIWISKTTSGLLVQRDATEIAIDAGAVPLAFGPLIVSLVDSGAALAHARRAGYEDGLNQGYINAQIAASTSERIAERQRNELVEALAVCELATAA